MRQLFFRKMIRVTVFGNEPEEAMLPFSAESKINISRVRSEASSVRGTGSCPRDEKPQGLRFPVCIPLLP